MSNLEIVASLATIGSLVILAMGIHIATLNQDEISDLMKRWGF